MKSKLKCPKCNYSFEYKWIPLVSFTAIRLGKKRYISCPNCNKRSWFDIWKTRIKTNV